MRAEFSRIPDFNDPEWQERRNDFQLLASILDGKDLVAYIRRVPGTRARRTEADTARLSADEFSKRFRELQKELAELQREFRQLGAADQKSKN
jgi:hypothetical protein